MTSYHRVLSCKLNDFITVQVVDQSRVNLTRELATSSEVGSQMHTRQGTDLIEEMVEELNVDEHRRRVSQLVRHDIEEDFGTQHVILRATFAPF